MTFEEYFEEDIEYKSLKRTLLNAYCWYKDINLWDKEICSSEFLDFIEYVENDEVALYDYILEVLREDERYELYDLIREADSKFDLEELRDMEKNGDEETYRYFHPIQYEMYPVMIKEMFTIDINYRFHLESQNG